MLPQVFQDKLFPIEELLSEELVRLIMREIVSYSAAVGAERGDGSFMSSLTMAMSAPAAAVVAETRSISDSAAGGAMAVGNSGASAFTMSVDSASGTVSQSDDSVGGLGGLGGPIPAPGDHRPAVVMTHAHDALKAELLKV